MNTDLLLAAAAAIDYEPESFDLARWGEVKPENLCGSSGCVAGQVAAIVNPQAWIEFLGEPWLYNSDPRHPSRIAQEALELTNNQAATLFQSGYWWAEAIKKLGLTDHYKPDELGETPEDMDPDRLLSIDVLGYVSPKQASEVLRALARGELTLDPQPVPNCECSYCTELRAERGEEGA